MGYRRPPIFTLVVAFVAACVLYPAHVLVRGEDRLVEVESAFVSQDEGGRGWTIGNSLLHYSFGQDGSAFVVREIADQVSGHDWKQSAAPDAYVYVNDQRVEIGSAATPFVRAGASEWYGGVKLDVTYRLTTTPMEFVRSYVAYPESSVIETWTTFRNTSTRTVSLSELTNFHLTIDNGELQWIRGLDVSDEDGGPFTIQRDGLADGQSFEIGASRRSSEENLPWFSVSSLSEDTQVAGTQFFGSVMWSGQWRFRARRASDRVAVEMGLPGFHTTLNAGASLESPHAIFGTTNSLVPDVSLATRAFIEHGVRRGRPFHALTTYNTWFTYGTFIDEGSMRAEMQVAAQMGIEQFVVDAGWWLHINADDASDFGHNWGNWEVDTERFPNGLGALSDYAHELGMRFGIWVEPERVHIDTVGLPGLAKERFLAKENGQYGPGDIAHGQICFASAEARAWVLEKLYAFIDDARPDYLKWDNNSFINCTRTSHGHGNEDGNFQHIRGLHDVLTELRDRYPEMDVENSASGGHRLALDMLEYTDVGWVDDRSSPSARVRHNLQGLTRLLPAAYLFTFAMGHETESMTAAEDADLKLLMRSRMGGMLGGTWSGMMMGEDTVLGIGSQVALYKQIRSIMTGGATVLPLLIDGDQVTINKQVTVSADHAWSGWDAIEHVNPRTGEAVVFAFGAAEGPPSIVVRPVGLRADQDYDVESADFGMLGTVSGSELMSRGIQLDANGLTKSHVLLFKLPVGTTARRIR